MKRSEPKYKWGITATALALASALNACGDSSAASDEQSTWPQTNDGFGSDDSTGSESTGSESAGADATGGSAADDSSSGGVTGGIGDDPFAGARQACVDRINAFRATEGKPPYQRWIEAEACADEQARLDAEANRGHATFGRCDEMAQNSCLRRRSLDSVIQNCLQAMWDEGPGEPFSEHGHYISMASTRYTKVACGFYQDAEGIWANQNFR